MIEINNICVELGEFSIFDISLSIKDGDFFVLLGPTGAGKTVLLEAIAGLVPQKSGAIMVDGRDISHAVPEKRGMSIVYQDYSLFPHLSVTENIRYGLRYHRHCDDEAAQLFAKLVDQLAIGHILDRDPTTLSGGEMQRVALARALLVRPRVLLLDEPLSAIDSSLRSELRILLKKLHGETGATFIMVTHDFTEALTMGTVAAVMNRGRIEQVGPVKDIFQRPRSTFVADFVGMKNILPATIKGTSARVRGLTVELARDYTMTEGFITLRPEDIILSLKPLKSSVRNSFRGNVRDIEDHGISCEVHMECDGVSFVAMVTKGAFVDLNLESGQDIYFSFKATAVHSFT